MTQKKILNFISLLLILIGFIGFVGAGLISLRVIDYPYELPLGNQGLVVSNDGRIFIGSDSYGKIQSYDSIGTFLKNWNTPKNGDNFRLKIKNDTIIVATLKGDNYVKYDLEGNLLSQTKVDDIYFTFEESYEFNSTKTITNYHLNNGLFFNSVSSDKNGQNKVIIKTPLLLKIFKGHDPAFLIVLIGVILRFIADKENIMRRLNKN